LIGAVAVLFLPRQSPSFLRQFTLGILAVDWLASLFLLSAPMSRGWANKLTARGNEAYLGGADCGGDGADFPPVVARVGEWMSAIGGCVEAMAWALCGQVAVGRQMARVERTASPVAGKKS
jgi:hypothetical protein